MRESSQYKNSKVTLLLVLRYFIMRNINITGIYDMLNETLKKFLNDNQLKDLDYIVDYLFYINLT